MPVPVAILMFGITSNVLKVVLEFLLTTERKLFVILYTH